MGAKQSSVMVGVDHLFRVSVSQVCALNDLDLEITSVRYVEATQRLLVTSKG